jgi:hypothetical protein
MTLRSNYRTSKCQNAFVLSRTKVIMINWKKQQPTQYRCVQNEGTFLRSGSWSCDPLSCCPDFLCWSNPAVETEKENLSQNVICCRHKSKFVKNKILKGCYIFPKLAFIRKKMFRTKICKFVTMKLFEDVLSLSLLFLSL